MLAVIFSLLLIAGYMAIRFEAKYAVPVMIAVVHDLLITAGVYAIVGAEVSSATIAAFLTILGYSLYDAVIVFDRIRENVPRLPRAAFSQIVNRSMSEVLTRSLITGLSTVFLITVLLVFGGETLQAFALAMLVGVASGTYSSIFIAAPVLTAWKEREPGFRARRRVIEEAMGRVPAFPEENVVAKLDEEAEREEGGEPGRSGTGFTDDPPRQPGPPEAIGESDPREGGDVAQAEAEPDRRPRRCPPRRPRSSRPRKPRPRRSAAPRPRGAKRARPASRNAASTGGPVQTRRMATLSALIWFTVGVALWHFTVFVPDRFWGGIVGAFVGAIIGAMITGFIYYSASGDSMSEADLVTLIAAIPGTILGLAVIYAIGARAEAKSA